MKIKTIPTFQQVIDWFRDIKHISILIDYDYITFDVRIYDFENSKNIEMISSLVENSPYLFTDHREAQLRAIEEALKLI